MIISKYIDEQAMTINSIIKDFKAWAKMQDYSKISKEQENEIRMLCKEYPILNILCAAMEEMGYESF